jgi:hypothetical protein
MDTIDADLDAISVAAQTYLDGLYEADADKLATVFHPSCVLTHMTPEGLQTIPRDTWLAAVRTRRSSKDQGLGRYDRILLLDRIGPTMALVKLNCAIPPRFFTDLLAFLKIDGRWQVAQKIFETEWRT